jgi:hypothetical protein
VSVRSVLSKEMRLCAVALQSAVVLLFVDSYSVSTHCE